MPTQALVIDDVRDAISRASGVSIGDLDASLIDLGVKSIDMLVIIGSLQNDFDIEFDSDDLTRENFTSARSIHALMSRIREGRLTEPQQGGVAHVDIA